MLVSVNSPRRIGFVDMDAFFVNVERLLDPKLKGRPVIVGGPSDSRGVVAAASYEVRKFGVHSAMPMRTALRLAPHAIVVQPSRGAYSHYSHQVLEIVQQHAPVVRQASVDEFYMDLTGCERLHGGRLIRALEKIKADVASLGLPCTVALAAGPVLAKIACSSAKPDGLIEIPVGREREFLAPIAIEEMPGIGPVLAPKLQRSGYRTLGDIQKSDARWWLSRFGDMGLEIWRKAQGIEAGILHEEEPAKSYSRETTFPADSMDPGWITTQLAQLVEESVFALRRDERAARTGTIKIRYADFKTHTHALTREASDDETVWWSVAKELLEKHLRRDWPVRLIGFRLSGISEAPAQPGLFDLDPVRRQRLGSAMDQLRVRYGLEALHRGAALAAPRPAQRTGTNG